MYNLKMTYHSGFLFCCRGSLWVVCIPRKLKFLYIQWEVNVHTVKLKMFKSFFHLYKNNQRENCLFRGYVDVTKAITKALLTNENGCRRCIFMHSWCSEPTSRVNAPFFIRWTLFLYIGPILDNMRKAEEFLQGQEDIDYSVVLPAALVKGKATGM